MSEHELVELEEELGLSRRDLFIKGGVLVAGTTFLGTRAADAFGAAEASSIKVAVVTHGDTGSFWSVFKKGVDQAKKDLKSRGVSVTQVYANNDVAKQVAGINAAIGAGAQVIATSVPDASALRDPLAKASKKGIEIITVNSGLGAFDSLPTYEVHVGQTETLAGKGAGKQFKKAGAKKVLIVIHEASNSGLQQRASGVKSVMGGSNVKVLTIPNAKSDIPGTKAKVKAAFNADKKLDSFLGLDPDVTIPCLSSVPKGTKVGTFDVGGSIKQIQAGKMLFAIDQQQYLQRYLPVVFGVQYGIVAVPVALLRIGGEFDLSAGVMIGSSGLLLGYLTTFQNINIWPAMALVMLFGVIIGLINGLTVIRTRLPSFIVTLATFFVLQGVNSAVTLKLTGQTAIQNIDSASGFNSAHKILAGDLTHYAFKVKVLWWIGITLIGAWLLAKTRFGNWIYSAGGEPNSAGNVSRPVAQAKVHLFVMTSCTAALMGIIEALELRSMQSGEGIGLEFIFIICAVVGGCLLTGGFGSVIGTFFGAAMLGMVQLGIVDAQWDSNWTFTFQGGILFAAVLLNTLIRSRAQKAR